jgi:hypothetical protein
MPTMVHALERNPDPAYRAAYWLIDFSWRNSEEFDKFQELAEALYDHNTQLLAERDALRAERGRLRAALGTLISDAEELARKHRSDAESFDHPLEADWRELELDAARVVEKHIKQARTALEPKS